MASADLTRRRAALAGAVGALAGTFGYVAGRAYFHLVIGGGAPTIILRESRVNFHLALVIAAFVGLVAALTTAELARSETRVATVEHALQRVALPTLILAVALVFLWP